MAAAAAAVAVAVALLPHHAHSSRSVAPRTPPLSRFEPYRTGRPALKFRLSPPLRTRELAADSCAALCLATANCSGFSFRSPRAESNQTKLWSLCTQYAGDSRPTLKPAPGYHHYALRSSSPRESAAGPGAGTEGVEAGSSTEGSGGAFEARGLSAVDIGDLVEIHLLGPETAVPADAWHRNGTTVFKLGSGPNTDADPMVVVSTVDDDFALELEGGFLRLPVGPDDALVYYFKSDLHGSNNTVVWTDGYSALVIPALATGDFHVCRQSVLLGVTFLPPASTDDDLPVSRNPDEVCSAQRKDAFVQKISTAYYLEVLREAAGSQAFAVEVGCSIIFSFLWSFACLMTQLAHRLRPMRPLCHLDVRYTPPNELLLNSSVHCRGAR